MIREAISKLVKNINLTQEETKEVFNQIMSGQATDSQIAAFITALRMKSETVDEITGAALAMREKLGQVIKLPYQEALLDTCGTGGSGINTFNISTSTAFVVAGCGIKVAKHGNRAVSGSCGSADVIEALGINLNLPVDKVVQALEEIGIAFFYAPVFHGAMKYAAGPRREIGIRTVFNILGPLCNPGQANIQVLGVYEAGLTETLAYVLGNLGIRHAFVVYGLDTLDEVSITTKTRVSQVYNKKVRTYYLKPSDFGLKPGHLSDLKGGDAKENAQIVQDILQAKIYGPKRDVVLANASVALVAAGKARDFRQGVLLAANSIDTGSALSKLELLCQFSQRCQ